MPWSASTRSAVCGVSSVTSAKRDGPAGSPSTVETHAVGTGSPAGHHLAFPRRELADLAQLRQPQGQPHAAGREEQRLALRGE